jgi:hypothetical protein
MMVGIILLSIISLVPESKLGAGTGPDVTVESKLFSSKD